MGEFQQQKDTQYASSVKTECDYLYGWIKYKNKQTNKKSQSQKWWTPEIELGTQKKKKKKSVVFSPTCSDYHHLIDVLVCAHSCCTEDFYRFLCGFQYDRLVHWLEMNTSSFIPFCDFIMQVLFGVSVFLLFLFKGVVAAWLYGIWSWFFVLCEKVLFS